MTADVYYQVDNDLLFIRYCIHEFEGEIVTLGEMSGSYPIQYAMENGTLSFPEGNPDLEKFRKLLGEALFERGRCFYIGEL